MRQNIPDKPNKTRLQQKNPDTPFILMAKLPKFPEVYHTECTFFKKDKDEKI